MKTLTLADLLAGDPSFATDVRTNSPAAQTMNRWLERGDGIAVYENVDLGHPHVGHRKYVSYGSHAAQLETDEPPERMPDIGGAINWRYSLAGVYRGPALSGDERPYPLEDASQYEDEWCEPCGEFHAPGDPCPQEPDEDDMVTCVQCGNLIEPGGAAPGPSCAGGCEPEPEVYVRQQGDAPIC